MVVGTDYHPFDRLVTWVDRWAGEHHDDVAAMVQYGAAAAPLHAEGRSLIGHDELQQLFSHATAVVTHGGPATIMEARRHGRLPLVVPRDPTAGEHVDGHQQRFARRLAERGLVICCEEEAGFREQLEHALADRNHLRLSAADDPSGVAAAAARVGVIVGQAVAEARRGPAAAVPIAAPALTLRSFLRIMPHPRKRSSTPDREVP